LAYLKYEAEGFALNLHFESDDCFHHIAGFPGYNRLKFLDSGYDLERKPAQLFILIQDGSCEPYNLPAGSMFKCTATTTTTTMS